MQEEEELEEEEQGEEDQGGEDLGGGVQEEEELEEEELRELELEELELQEQEEFKLHELDGHCATLAPLPLPLLPPRLTSLPNSSSLMNTPSPSPSSSLLQSPSLVYSANLAVGVLARELREMLAGTVHEEAEEALRSEPGRA